VSAEERRELERREAELVRALGGGPSPPGVDSERMRLTAEAVAGKRARLVRHGWPALALELGERFETMFAEYVKAEPGGEEAIADGLLFARRLDGLGLLNDEARVEARLVAAEWRVARGRAVRRRAPYVAAVRVRRPRRVVLIWRLGGRLRHLTIRR
jgi:hypothetical protein